MPCHGWLTSLAMRAASPPKAPTWEPLAQAGSVFTHPVLDVDLVALVVGRGGRMSGAPPGRCSKESERLGEGDGLAGPVEASAAVSPACSAVSFYVRAC